MKTKIVVLVVAASVAVLAAPPAAGQSGSNEWQFALAPYLWASGMDGTLAIADLETDFEAPFSTIIENLDFAFMGHFDMRNDRWVLMSDLIFVDLEAEEDLAEGTVTTGLDMTLFEVAGGYRVSQTAALLVGARWVDLGTSVRYEGEFVDPGASVGKSYVDPLVGIHVFAPLSEKWWVGLYGDVGGFDVGSKLTWQVYADIGWRASHLVSIVLGYRVLDIDYEDGEGVHLVGLDVMMSGPQLGVVFSF